MTVKHLEVVDTDKNLLCSFPCHLLLHFGVIMLGLARNMLTISMAIMLGRVLVDLSMKFKNRQI